VDKVRFLMIGGGGIIRHHLNQLKDVPEAEIVGIAEPNSAQIALLHERLPELKDVPVFDDYRTALQEVQADAAIIGTPHSYHYEQGMEALKAGLHVLMEKPFVSGSENAERIIAFAKEQGKHLAVSYQRHLQPPYLFIRELVQSGALGRIQFVTAYQAQAWLTGTKGTWRQDPALSCGGQLNDSGSHLLDIVLWLTGLEPEEVTAFIDNRGAEVDIDTVLSVRFKGGALGSFNIVGSSSLRWWEDVSVHGDEGTVLFRNGAISVQRKGETSVAPVSAEQLPAGSNPAANFVELVLGRIEQPAAPSSCGLIIARLSEAAWESAERGAPVKL
jgi:predicted dehydrogenase